MFDPILRAFAASQNNVALRYRTRLVSFTQNADLVTAVVENAETGAREEIPARYIVGCDGARSMVRETLGIAMQGNPALTYTTNVIFRCPHFVAARQGQGLPPHLHRPGRHLGDHRRDQRPRRVALLHHRRLASSANTRPTTSGRRSAAPSAAISTSRF